MLDALTYQEMLRNIKQNMEYWGVKDDIIGIHITRPDLNTGKNILDSLEYYHFRTGKSVNFYLPGYGAYWTEGTYPDGKKVTSINCVDWWFSNKMFSDFISDLEKHSKWKYSGESELLLVDLKKGILSYENVLQFYLDDMLRSGVITTVHNFFEQLFRIMREKDSVNQISNDYGVDKLKQISKDEIIKRLPLRLGQVYEKEKHFCVRNLQK